MRRKCIVFVFGALEMKRAALGTGHSLSLCRLGEIWVRTLERGLVHSIGCWIGSSVRSLMQWWCAMGACSPWVVEQSQILQTLRKPFLDARKDIYNSHSAKEAGILNSARSHAQTSLTGGSHTSPVRKSSPFMKGFLSPWRPGSYSLLWMQELHDLREFLTSPLPCLSSLSFEFHFSLLAEYLLWCVKQWRDVMK